MRHNERHPERCAERSDRGIRSLVGVPPGNVENEPVGVVSTRSARMGVGPVQCSVQWLLHYRTRKAAFARASRRPDPWPVQGATRAPACLAAVGARVGGISWHTRTRGDARGSHGAR